MKRMKKYLDWLLNLCFCLCVVLIMWLLLQVTTFASFKIPSDSMTPTLLPGDNILVNKWLMGGRVFDIWEAVEGKDTEIYRLPGVKKIARNDVVVFNFPYPERDDSITLDMKVYYVKRCIALPGDTLEIRNGHYRIRGYDGEVGHLPAQRRIAALINPKLQGVVMGAYPWDGHLNWTIQEFGPLHLPASGQTVQMDSTAAKLYRPLLVWEQKKTVTRKGNDVYLGDSLIREYTFKENYYFMGGDNMENSRDSRYWGLLPESFIVGTATRIWKSVNKHTDEVRWNRVFKEIE